MVNFKLFSFPDFLAKPNIEEVSVPSLNLGRDLTLKFLMESKRDYYLMLANLIFLPLRLGWITRLLLFLGDITLQAVEQSYDILHTVPDAFSMGFPSNINFRYS